MNSIKCASLNVCGLKRRVEFPDFYELVNKYDLFFVVETKLDANDVISLPNFKFINKPRKQPFIRKSGGLGIFIRDLLLPHCEILDCDSDFILWLKLSKLYCNTDQDVIFGVTYIPPLQSRFYTLDEFEAYENEIITKCSQYDKIFLCGDWNAQTSNLLDYSESDDFLNNHFQIDGDNAVFLNQEERMRSLGIPLTRLSADNKINNHGRSLIDTCKNNLIILNGRLGFDSAKMTFRNISTIDYVIISLDAFKHIEALNINTTDRLFSDGDALLEYNVKCRSSISTAVYSQCAKNSTAGKPIPKASLADEFSMNI